jgi:peptidoglycan L-alanyl-D-glutamate endopeptidase CwlK
MPYRLSKLSLSRLEGVHPDLVAVVKEAIQWTAQDFLVVEGRRTKEQAYRNFGKGRTYRECQLAGCPVEYARPTLKKVTWVRNPLGSKHVIQGSGYGHAMDLYPYPIPKDLDRPGPETLDKFRAIAKAMEEAAQRLHVPIEWGGTWKVGDYPHFELKTGVEV